MEAEPRPLCARAFPDLLLFVKCLPKSWLASLLCLAATDDAQLLHFWTCLNLTCFASCFPSSVSSDPSSRSMRCRALAGNWQRVCKAPSSRGLPTGWSSSARRHSRSSSPFHGRPFNRYVLLALSEYQLPSSLYRARGKTQRSNPAGRLPTFYRLV